MTQFVYRPFMPVARLQPTSPAATRTPVFTDRITRPVEIVEVRYTFEDNDNRTSRLRFWLCESDTTREAYAVSGSGSAGTMPSTGRNLLAGIGVDYVVGDGIEGERTIPLGMQVTDGFLCADLDNLDATYTHEQDVTFILRELLSQG